MKRWWSLFLEAVRGSDRDYTDWSRRSGARDALGAHGPGNGHGVAVRRRRRVLRVARQRRRGGHGRHHRIDDDHRLHGGAGPQHRRDGGGVAPRRRKGRGRRRAGGGPVDCARAPGGARRRALRLLQRGAPDACDGRDAVDDRVVARLHAGDVCRQRHGDAAVPQQRDLPRRRRPGHRDAHVVARQRHQHRRLPVPDLRHRPVSGNGGHRRGARHEHRPRHGGAHAVVDAVVRAEPHPHPAAAPDADPGR